MVKFLHNKSSYTIYLYIPYYLIWEVEGGGQATTQFIGDNYTKQKERDDSHLGHASWTSHNYILEKVGYKCNHLRSYGTFSEYVKRKIYNQ